MLYLFWEPRSAVCAYTFHLRSPGCVSTEEHMHTVSLCNITLFCGFFRSADGKRYSREVLFDPKNTQ